MTVKVEYAPVRLTAAGNIRAAAGKLTSLIVNNPSGGALTVKLNDATSGTGSDVFEVSVPTLDCRILNFNPPLLFSTGIRCGTVGAGLIITGTFVD